MDLTASGLARRPTRAPSGHPGRERPLDPGTAGNGPPRALPRNRRGCRRPLDPLGTATWRRTRGRETKPARPLRAPRRPAAEAAARTRDRGPLGGAPLPPRKARPGSEGRGEGPRPKRRRSPLNSAGSGATECRRRHTWSAVLPPRCWLANAAGRETLAPRLAAAGVPLEATEAFIAGMARLGVERPANLLPLVRRLPPAMA